MEQTKTFGKKRINRILRILRDARESATFERADFGAFWENPKNPNFEKDNPTEFIKRRTKLYRESWIIHRLDEVIKMLEPYDLK